MTSRSYGRLVATPVSLAATLSGVRAASPDDLRSRIVVRYTVEAGRCGSRRA